MNDRTPTRNCDVAIVGGSAAGLAAALQLGRQRRSVIVVDGGEPRNAPAEHMHGFLGRDGEDPALLLAVGRAEARSYGVEVLSGQVDSVTHRSDGRFQLDLAGGHLISARRVLAATGVTDQLPPIDGLRERWGRQVIHCPFCHGYEVRDQRIVQILDHPVALHQAMLFSRLSSRITAVVAAGVGLDDTATAPLVAAGVTLISGDVRAIAGGTGAGSVDGGQGDGSPLTVELASGEQLETDVVVVGPRFAARAQAFEPVGLRAEAHLSGLGTAVVVDARGATAVPGIYAAGNVADPSQQVLHAAADGSRVAAMIAADLAGEDLDAGSRGEIVRPSAEAEWDERYGGDPIWSGNPNGALVREVADLRPGTALDVGAGEGGDAIWLAEAGWQVTAADISGRALGRIAAEAQRRGLAIEVRQADANTLDPLGEARFDLVTAHYASIPRTPDSRAAKNLMEAVAPGGTLLFVTHDPAPMRENGALFDPDAYLGAEDLAALLDPNRWKVEGPVSQPRPHGAASGHHVDDIVLRAQRI